MKVFENEIQRLVYDEFGDELEAKDKEIEAKNQEIKTQKEKLKTLTESNKAYEKKIKQLKKIGDTNSPKAQEIIRSLMLI